MENIRTLLSRLSSNFGAIKETISIENSNNNQSLNLLLETLLIKIYNITNNVKLENSNLVSRNFEGIDGIDKENRLMAQITSTFSPVKIEKTVDKILKNDLYKDYDTLIFIFLSNKKNLTPAFKNRIKKKIEGKFNLDLNAGLIDLKSIYNLHAQTQDIEKIHAVVGLLDEVLKYKPSVKESGFDILSVCFHEEELENVFILIDAILREGINVYISSKSLYDKFQKENHPLRNYLIFADPLQSVGHIKFCITVLSNTFINQIINASPSLCNLFTSAIENEIKIEVISFDPYLKDIKKITDHRIKSYRSIHLKNIESTVKRIIQNKTARSFFGNISLEEVQQELIKTHHNFICDKILDNSDFCLLNLKMPDQDDLEFNYIILTKDFILNNVINKFNELKKKYSKNLNILVPKDFDHKTRRRIDIVKNGFNTARVYYIDEHLFDKRYKSLVQKTILNTNEFVYPVVKHNDDFIRINDIIYWIINNSDSSIAIIHGSGGIGKTTICEKIHDIILEDHERNIIIFIDASQYIEVLKKRIDNDEAEYDLYNIFKACHSHGTIIDKHSFYLNYALGNIVVIFDGIDEIISTIPSFNLYTFLDNLENLRLNIGKGKILINCRDTYVSDLKNFYSPESLEKIQIYELLPFNEDLAKKFFSKHFTDEKMVRSCMKLAREFYPDENDTTVYIYPPFILEVIVQIVDADFTYTEIDADFNSKLLQFNEPNDIVVNNICNREYFKKEKHGFQLSIDDQIRFLCVLAIEEKGKISSDEFSKILLNIGITDRILDVVSGLKDHPLLLKTNGYYVFRFDFFNTYFKSIAIFNLLCTNSSFKLTEKIIDIFSYDCNFNSLISKTLINKANNSQISFDDCLQYSNDIIHQIIGFELKGAKGIRREKSISNILLVILASVKPKKYATSVILKSLFKNEKGEICNFSFIDVPFESAITFEYSDLYFTKATIINYGNYFNCKFSSDTFFDESCYIENVYNNKVNLKSITANLSNFDKNIKGDNSIFRIMNIKNNEGKDLKRFFKDYFGFFYVSRQFKSELLEKTIITIKDDFVSVKLLSNILKNNGIVVKMDNGKIQLDEKLKFKIINFLSQGILFKELNKSISELKVAILRGESQGFNFLS